MPKVVDHDERRATIVRATCTLIADEGLDSATMRRIADRAGSTTGLVTHYFGSKDEVLLAALQHVHRAAGARMTAAVRDLDGDEPLRAVVGEALPLDDERRNEWKVWLAFWGRAASDDALAAEQRARYVEWKALLASLLPNDGRTAVDELIALIDGIGMRATLDPDGFPPAVQRALVEPAL
ncbi:MAG: TetR family transcriptional regulator C-terminal domain-containing protein [Actinomycetota bacterium]